MRAAETQRVFTAIVSRLEGSVEPDLGTASRPWPILGQSVSEACFLHFEEVVNKTNNMGQRLSVALGA